jgi:hypothetical protein
LAVVEEEFDLAAAELIRIGALDAMKLYPLSRKGEERSRFDLAWPASLRERLKAAAAVAHCTLEHLLEHLLWQVVIDFPHYPGPLRSNPEGHRKVQECLAKVFW